MPQRDFICVAETLSLASLHHRGTQVHLLPLWHRDIVPAPQSFCATETCFCVAREQTGGMGGRWRYARKCGATGSYCPSHKVANPRCGGTSAAGPQGPPRSALTGLKDPWGFVEAPMGVPIDPMQATWGPKAHGPSISQRITRRKLDFGPSCFG